MKNELLEGIDFYYNEEGYLVLSEAYHLQRGSCCGNGCKHCPYDYENVPEIRRPELMRRRIEAGGK
ncbi:MAG: DUF5522 domain-containing protein [Chitinophagales bacterium]